LLIVRSGLYYEPSRYQSTTGRLHWTAGADLRVPIQLDFRLSAVLDVASEYSKVAFGLGLWQ
ncbi:MAG TPA: hypothetical protein DCQ06_05415, partial [Myxococcales bacterium]|nr:hypothetical protein [Myxococcales bacterium]